jgi:uncharacterized protein
MQFEHEFTVPVPADQAWDILLDVERIAPCMPGATVTSVEGDSFTGQVKVKVGPITVAYAGSAAFTEKDVEARRVTVTAKGKETRGAGTAAATVAAVLHDEGEQTRVTVNTDLAITGRPAQFGRGVMDDVGRKLLGQFADCVASQLTAGGLAGAEAGTADMGTAEAGSAPGGAATATGGGTAPAGGESRPVVDRPTPDTINAFDVAGASVAKRLAPVLAVIVVLIGVWALFIR